jgi:hypothetical protein
VSHRITRTVADDLEIELEIAMNPAERATLEYPGCEAEVFIDSYRVMGQVTSERQALADAYVRENRDDIEFEAIEEVRDSEW